MEKFEIDSLNILIEDKGNCVRVFLGEGCRKCALWSDVAGCNPCNPNPHTPNPRDVRDHRYREALKMCYAKGLEAWKNLPQSKN